VRKTGAFEIEEQPKGGGSVRIRVKTASASQPKPKPPRSGHREAAPK